MGQGNQVNNEREWYAAEEICHECGKSLDHYDCCECDDEDVD